MIKLSSFSLVQDTTDECKTRTLNVNNTEIKLADKIKYLGVLLDWKLNLKQHITSKCQTAMLNIQHIKNIRHLLTQEATEILVLGTVMSILTIAVAY